MKTKKIFSAILVTAIFLSGQFVFSQTKKENKLSTDNSSYNTAIGLRVGETSGATIKPFFVGNNALEGVIGVWPYAFGLTGLYERHEKAFNTDGMRWYYGGGGHATFGTGNIYYVYYNGERRYYKYESGSLGLGIDGILGLEYKIKAIPFVVGIDVKPFLEINNSGALYIALDPGIGIKIAF